MTDEERASELFDWIVDYTACRQFGAAGLERAECFGRISLAFQEVRAERDAELQRLRDELDAEKRAHGAHHSHENEASAIVRELVGNTYDVPIGVAERIDAWGKKYGASK